MAYALLLLLGGSLVCSVGGEQALPGDCDREIAWSIDQPLLEQQEEDAVEEANMQLLQQGLHLDKANSSVAVQPSLEQTSSRVQPALQTFSRTWQEPVVTTTLDPTGMTLNGEGDLEIFISAMIFNLGLSVAFVVAFNVLRVRYPPIFENNIITGSMPGRMSKAVFGWWNATMNVSVDEVADNMGLDQAMFIEFCHLGMRMMAIIGIPMLFIFGPMNYLFGGNAAGADHLSYLSWGNVVNDSPLYWIYAFVVWGVVFAVQHEIMKAQKAFMARRFKWLREMAVLRANTILVEGIPDEYCSDQKLHEFFEEVMPGDENVNSAYVAKDTSKLLPKAKALETARISLKQAQAEWDAQGNQDADRPMTRANSMPLSPKVDAIELHTQELERLELEVAEERETLTKLTASTVGGVNLSRGFVTFNGRVEAEIALRLTGISENLDEWSFSTPPAPEDIQWNDLTQDPTAERVRTFIGYLCVAGLYFLYMPAVIFITNISNLINMGPLQPLWEGLAPTMGLLLMVCFLPTFLILIFQLFFTLKAGQWAQFTLQNWYFWFQVFFVILGAAVGQNTLEFTTALFTDPVEVFHILARTMPYATHFFMNYQLAQVAHHFQCFTRYVPLMKFVAFSKIWDEEDARKLAEPEDQDYYGMGGRTARFTIALSIGIIYGTLSPPICFLTFLLFASKRIVYGYLLPFAETKKTDLGGLFWVNSLRHLYVANIIYVILMAGVLLERNTITWWPASIAGSSGLYVLYCMKHFETAFNWRNLPLGQVIEMEANEKQQHKRAALGAYVQPEMMTDEQVLKQKKAISDHIRSGAEGTAHIAEKLAGAAERGAAGVGGEAQRQAANVAGAAAGVVSAFTDGGGSK